VKIVFYSSEDGNKNFTTTTKNKIQIVFNTRLCFTIGSKKRLLE
jgi:hypothetical protein